MKGAARAAEVVGKAGARGRSAGRPKPTKGMRTAVVLAGVVSLTAVVGPAYAASQGSAGRLAATPTRLVSASAQPTTTSTPTVGGGAGAPSATDASPSPTTATAATSSPLPTAPAPYTPPAAPPGAVTPTATTIEPESTFSIRTDPAGKQAFDETWPDAGLLFTAGELAQVIPGVSGVRSRDCTNGQVVGGRASRHSMRCTIELAINGEPADNQSRIMVNIRGFGLPAAIGKSWSAQEAGQRGRAERRTGLYTFYRNGSLGTAAAYTDGTTTRVLLQRGPVAGEVWFSGIGFAHLKSTYLASRQDYRDRLVPALVQLLAAKVLPAG